MEIGTTVLGAVAGGILGAMSGEKGAPLKYALWGGGIGFGVGLLRGDKGDRFLVGDLLSKPFSLPTPSQPGQFVYDVDPRRDPLLDPVSRRRLYPQWLLAHWQNNDSQVIAHVQSMLGVPADGIIGPGTSSAIQAYQQQHGLPVSGNMDRMTLEALVGS